LTDTIRTAFLAGFPQQLRQMLEVVIVNSGSNNIDMPKLFKSAEEFGRIFNSDNISTGAKALALSGPTTDPNAMEIDNIRVQLNNINRQISNINRTVNNRNNGHPPPLSKEDYEWCQRNNACRRCRQIGHHGYNCPVYSNNNNNNNNNRSSNNNGNNGNNGYNGYNNYNNNRGRRVNQVTVGISPESGKASDDQE
ncbi:hypothetical protein EC991_010729, partial [Linnemannia zychae]